MRATVVAAAVLCTSLAGAGRVAGQSLPVGDTYERYLRLLQLAGRADQGSFTVRPIAADYAREATSSEGHPWRDRLRREDREGEDLAWDVEGASRVVLNTRHPWGGGDGAVWQGKGVTTLIGARVTMQWKAISVTLDPTLLYNQNAAFELAPVIVAGQSEYAYPWRRIDLPQRFGPKGFWTTDLGQSEVSADWRAFRVSFGTKNLWWGPGIENAIIMSNNAPGFRHLALGTVRPLDVSIGELEAQWVWGHLDQSEWFLPLAESASRFFTGVVATFSPEFLPGLSVGGTRVFQLLRGQGGVDVGEYFLVFQGIFKKGLISPEQPTGTDERDQLLSVFARWALPESGFEAYIEWARNDHNLDLQDFLLEPEHSSGYTLGFQKVTSSSTSRLVVLRGEATRLEASPTFQLRPRPTYYEHGVVTQGYTQRGQVIGASIGPGGNSQLLGVDLYEPWGSAGLHLRRNVHDNDAFWVWAAANGRSFDRHNVSFDLGGNALVFVDDFELGAGLVVTHELNRYFFGPDVWNLNLSLSARWRPGVR